MKRIKKGNTYININSTGLLSNKILKNVNLSQEFIFDLFMLFYFNYGHSIINCCKNNDFNCDTFKLMVLNFMRGVPFNYIINQYCDKEDK